MKLSEQVNKEIKDLKIPEPILEFSFFSVSVFVWKYFNIEVDLVESYPYEPDGTTPLIMIQLGFVEFMFENKRLYSYLYKRKHGFKPMGLE